MSTTGEDSDILFPDGEVGLRLDFHHSMDAFTYSFPTRCDLCGESPRRGRSTVVLGLGGPDDESGKAAIICWECLPIWADRQMERQAMLPT